MIELKISIKWFLSKKLGFRKEFLINFSFSDLICLLFPALLALILASLFVLAKREKPLRGQKIEFWGKTNKLQLLQVFLLVAAVVSFVWRQIAAKIYRSLESSLLHEIKIIRIYSHKIGSVTGYNDGLLIQTNPASILLFVARSKASKCCR